MVLSANAGAGARARGALKRGRATVAARPRKGTLHLFVQRLHKQGAHPRLMYEAVADAQSSSDTPIARSYTEAVAAESPMTPLALTRQCPNRRCLRRAPTGTSARRARTIVDLGRPASPPAVSATTEVDTDMDHGSMAAHQSVSAEHNYDTMLQSAGACGATEVDAAGCHAPGRFTFATASSPGCAPFCGAGALDVTTLDGAVGSATSKSAFPAMPALHAPSVQTGVGVLDDLRSSSCSPTEGSSSSQYGAGC